MGEISFLSSSIFLEVRLTRLEESFLTPDLVFFFLGCFLL